MRRIYLFLIGIMFLNYVFGRSHKDSIVIAKKLDFLTLKPSLIISKPDTNSSFYQLKYKEKKLQSITSFHPVFGKKTLKVYYVNDSLFYYINYTYYENFFNVYESELCFFNTKSHERFSLFLRSESKKRKSILFGSQYKINIIEKEFDSVTSIKVRSYTPINNLDYMNGFDLKQFIELNTEKQFSITIYKTDQTDQIITERVERNNKGEEQVIGREVTEHVSQLKYLWHNFYVSPS